jgi:methyltransferase-like protein/SAM-dependent methyltransferase
MTDKAVKNTFIYDEVPYPSTSFIVSHPDNLATLATLLGMRPSPVEHCRVLELGCASGGNIVPMALSLPESEFVGIDLSGRQIAEGQAMVDAVGLKNVTLQHMNILDVNADFGQFDYIITHGIYSWVPSEVQDKILEICKQNLAPNGVAYISYNTYPGWHMLGALRHMMLYHTREVTDPRARAAEARALLDLLTGLIPDKGSPYSSYLKAYLTFYKQRYLPRGDEAMIHDELAEVNEPIYFYQFAERAERHGLQYLADAQFQTMLASNLPAEMAEALRKMAQDTISLEQYMDFLHNRTFRQTLLCHEDVRLSGSPHPDLLANFYVASPALPAESELNIHSVSVEKFRASDGTILSTDHPVTKAGVLYLTEIWPYSVPFKALLNTARARVNGAQADVARDAEVLAANLLQAYGCSDNLVELHVCPHHFVLEISDRPVASPVARFQAQNGTLVTNMRHERIELSGTIHRLLSYLDGSRDRAALLGLLERWAAEGVIQLRQEEKPAEEAEQAGQTSEFDEGTDLAEMLDSRLHQLAHAALLVG